MKATGRADLAANEKVLDLYTSNLQLEEQLHGVRRQVDDAKAIAEKVRCQPSSWHTASWAPSVSSPAQLQGVMHHIFNHPDATHLMSKDSLCI